MSALLKPAERPPIVGPTETEIDLLIAEAGGNARLAIKVLLYQLNILAFRHRARGLAGFREGPPEVAVMMAAREVTASPVDIALRKTVKLGEYFFEPPIKLVCEKLGIVPPEEGAEIECEGKPYRVFRFVWPDDATAFLKHFAATDYEPRVL